MSEKSILLASPDLDLDKKMFTDEVSGHPGNLNFPETIFFDRLFCPCCIQSED